MGLESFVKKFSGLTEEYKFYNDTVTLRYEPENHIYYLLTEDNQLIPQAGVTTVCHIIDKSQALIPWACKMMAEKLLRTVPKEFGHVAMREEDFLELVLAAKNAHKEKLEEASDIGHMAHAWIEDYIKAVLAGDETKKLEILGKFPSDEKAASCCQAALSWMQRHNVRWISTERKIYSRTYEYAGTMDGLALVDSCDDPLCCPNHFKDFKAVIDWKSSNYLYLEYLFQTAAYQQAYQEETGEQIDDRWVIRLGKVDGEFEPWHLTQDDYFDDIAGFLLCLDLHLKVKLLEERIKKSKDYIKAERKKIKDLEREEALKLKCKSADKYKGVRYPVCNGGNPCQSCLAKFKEKHPEIA